MYKLSSFFVTELPIQGVPGTPGLVYNEGPCGGVAANKKNDFDQWES